LLVAEILQTDILRHIVICVKLIPRVLGTANPIPQIRGSRASFVIGDPHNDWRWDCGGEALRCVATADVAGTTYYRGRQPLSAVSD